MQLLFIKERAMKMLVCFAIELEDIEAPDWQDDELSDSYLEDAVEL